MEQCCLEGGIRSKRQTRSGRPVEIWQVLERQLRAAIARCAGQIGVSFLSPQVIVVGTKKMRPAHRPAAEHGSRTGYWAGGFQASRRFRKCFPIRWPNGSPETSRGAYGRGSSLPSCDDASLRDDPQPAALCDVHRHSSPPLACCAGDRIDRTQRPRPAEVK